jgi:cellulose synthase (UDP-forming)
MFEAVSLAQHKQLVQLLFCRPGQWKSRCAPSELRSLFLLLKILLKPRVIFDRETNPRLVNLTRE